MKLLTLLFSYYIIYIMNNTKMLTQKLYELLSLMTWEIETPREYGGVGFTLPHSEVHLLDKIKVHAGAKAGELAGYMNITPGAVSQLSKKLLDKGLVESYREADNRKEVFFRLTPLGEQVYAGHQAHHELMNADFHGYIDRLNERDLQVILDFLDAMNRCIEKVKDQN